MRRSALGALAAASIVLAVQDPAAADNCGSLTDCSAGVRIGLAILGIVIIAAIAIFAWEVLAAAAIEEAAALGAEEAAALAAEEATALAAEEATAVAAEDAAAGAEEVAGASAADGPTVAPPEVSDPKLGNYVEQLFKHAGRPGTVGDGTTMAAVREEVAAGGGRHVQKAKEIVKGLTKWLERRGPTATPSDREVARSLLQQLLDALGSGP